ncbi:S8 family serine peptidase [Streptomyces sp. CAU 1734]|uniref:S8 family serine peptidase n=1 Tax=Streptomyces sp. CAU 1734 TaxID=3140360 RepID=UPI003260D385
MPRSLRRGVWRALAVAGVWAVGVTGTVQPASASNSRLEQWYFETMRVEEMWKVSTGKGITVAVIDTGVKVDTPSLQGRALKGLDASGLPGDETDDYSGHGTTMAELIAGTGKNGGIRGMAPSAKIIPFRIADTERDNQEGDTNAQDSEDAIRAAADSGAQIISMSFASEFSTVSERAAVEYARSKGKLFFAGTGNNAEDGNKPQYPAAYPDVVGVAAADRTGLVADYSQHGDNVDLGAPGGIVPRWCDTTFTRYCDGSGGTSSATAIASGSAALIWSANPDWTANQVLRAMIDTAGRDWKKGTKSTYLGHGLIRPRQILLEGKGDPGAPDISPLTNRKTTVASASPEAGKSPSAPASSQPPKGGPGGDKAVAGSREAEKAGNAGWVGPVLGGGAALLVLAGAGFLVLRKRRNA